MVLEAATHAIATAGVYRVLPYVGTLVGLYGVRTWASGFRNKQSRNLANKTFILIGGFSGPGLTLFHSLAAHGAQVIALHACPSSPDVLQLILLLRATSGNERLYADECDMLSLDSIRSFVKRWEKDARSGMVNDLEARIEGIIFCDGEGCGVNESGGIGVGKFVVRHDSGTEKMERYHMAFVLGKHALIQLLLPTLLRSATHTPVRIINQISPFYSACAPSSTSLSSLSTLDYLPPSSYPSLQPWLAEGLSSLLSIVLLRELQLRVDEHRPPGSGGLVIVSVCGGFSRAWCRRTLRADGRNENFMWMGFVAWLLLLPAIWLLTKSAAEAAQGIEMVVMAETRKRDRPDIVGEEKEMKEEEGGVKKVKEKGREEEIVSTVLRGGAVYREGTEMRIRPLEVADPKFSAALWETESRRVERLVAAAATREAEAAKTNQQPTSKGDTTTGGKKSESTKN